jgi:NAD+ synthase
MPERDSDPLSLNLGRDWANALGVPWVIEDIGPVCDALGLYRRRDAAIRKAIPEFTPEWRFKIVLPGNRLDSDRLNVYSIHAVAPDGTVINQRLNPETYREIVAATNFKQRVRKMMEYYHADRMHYAVIGTPNRLEYDQGFFVKGGDGLADVKPIAHLYKTQVYQLARHLGVISGVTDRPPTTDTYSLPQTQEEFYFALPTKMMDLALYYRNQGLSAAQAAEILDLRPEQVERAYKDIDQKRSTTRYLHEPPLLVENVFGTHGVA